MKNEFSGFLDLVNASAVYWQDIPEFSVEDFVANVASGLEKRGRIASMFGVSEDEGTRLVVVLAYDAENTLEVGRSIPFAGEYPSITQNYPQAHMFEREIYEQHGLVPHGHPWLKPVRKSAGNAPENGPFFKVEGSEIHEVAVGPVHAGIIEPGHFRFQCSGEEVIHLEIALGYQHRGIEEAVSGGPHRSTLYQMETIAGDTTVGHTTAYAQVVESLSGYEPPLRVQWLRAIGLELERLANHTGDLGALAGDVAFLPTSSACGKIRGDFLNLTAVICGNRFGRGLVKAGPGLCDLPNTRISEFRNRFDEVLQDAEQAAEWLFDSASVRGRFENVGIVKKEDAEALGLLGPAARASGLVRDVRFDHPTDWFRFGQTPVSVWPGGDVFSRAKVRWMEIQRSGRFIQEQLMLAPDAEAPQPTGNLAPEMFAVSMVEGWRGSVCHAALTDAQGRFRRYKITDPSFQNWTGLALALRGQEISDFPICNKSFNLSYCGFDL